MHLLSGRRWIVPWHWGWSPRPSREQLTISYAITVCDELEGLRRLVNILGRYLAHGDEIVIQHDTSKTSADVLHYLGELTKRNGVVRVVPFPLANDFAAFKNNLKAQCRSDYVFQIDADEFPAEYLLQYLRAILARHAKADVLLMPRINTVEGLTDAQVAQWGWQVNARGWVNFPDLQTRICRNRETISWMGAVHERLVGGGARATLPLKPKYALFHPKEIARQQQQNSFYEALQGVAPHLPPQKS